MACSSNLFYFTCQIIFFSSLSPTCKVVPLLFTGMTLPPPQNPPPCGLPQGAVLSTTLFSIYLSDMPHHRHTHHTLYADDTAFLSQSCQPDTIAHRLINAVTTLCKYFTTQKLWLNTHKTETILFSKCLPPLPGPIEIQDTLCPGCQPSAI